MKSWLIRLCLFIIIASAPAVVFGREDPEAVLERDWRTTAAEAKLSPAAIQHLEKEKVLMTKEEFFQCFQAYFPNYEREGTEDITNLPYFITTDALFQAYAWCLQKATAKMESAHAGQVREYLEVLMASLNQVDSLVAGDAAQMQKAKDLATFVIGVAAVLMNARVEIKSAALRHEIELEAARVRRAEGTGWPAGMKLSLRDASSLDYTLFKPVGLYVGDDSLEPYFRAVRWLQLVGFRASSDEHMLAAAMVSLSSHRLRLRQLKLDAEAAERFDDRDTRLVRLAGPTVGASALHCAWFPGQDEKPAKKASEWIQGAREATLRMAASSQKAAGVAITTSPRQESPTDVSAHLLEASTLTDALLLEKLSQAKGEGYFPNALSIASWLGSSYAAEQEKANPKAEVILQESRQWLDASVDSPSLHQESLMLLQQLVAPPPADAPAFMKSRTWQVKSCQTVLASWAQSRHVWALQARPQFSVAAGLLPWPAFVEPHSDFFVGLAGLCRKAAWMFGVRESEAVVNGRVARRLRQMADDYGPQVSSEERMAMGGYETTLTMLLEAGVEFPDKPWSDPGVVADFTQILRSSADVIERGDGIARNPVAQKLRENLVTTRKVPFDDLERTCLRLAVLVHKQARGLPANAEESHWLLTFGNELASFSDCHFTQPVDNVPKAVRVFTNPELGKALTVGIGRPRFLYVLYPWKGTEVLCRGAVLPYLERHELESLTDEEWREKLHDKRAPAIQPAWVAPLMAE